MNGKSEEICKWNEWITQVVEVVCVVVRMSRNNANIPGKPIQNELLRNTAAYCRRCCMLYELYLL